MNREQSTSNEKRPAPRIAWAGLGLIAFAFAFAHLRAGPPDVVPRSADQSLFSAERALDHLRRIEGDGRPHPVGSEAAARVRGEIVARLDALGLAPEIQERLAAGRNGVVALVRNVVARIPGREAGPCVLLAAHYDSVSAGPGSSDDGAGTAAVLEIARALSTSPPARNDVVLLLDEGEEAGLIGARAFVDAHPLAARIGVVVNLEARGTSGRAHMFETSADNSWLIAPYARSVPHPAAVSVASEIYKRMPNDTDLTVFKQHGLPGMNFAFIGGVARYHTPLDDVAHLDPRSLQHLGESALALVRELGEADLARHAAGDAVYFDVFGFALVHWPAAWCLPLAVLAALVVRHTLRGAGRRALLVGFGGALAGLVATAALAHGIVRALVLARGVAEPWSAHPLPARLAVVAGAVTLGLVIARYVLEHGCAAREARVAAHALLAALALVAAIWIPSASYVLLVPALVAALTSLLTRTRWTEALALLAPLCAAAILLAPLLLGIEESFGFRIGAALGAPLGLLVMLLAPACVAASGRFLALLGLGGAVAFVAALCVPAHDVDSPAWLNLAHVHDARANSAAWYAIPIGIDMPRALREAGPFTDARAAPSAWWTRASLSCSAPAEPSASAAPRLDVLGETRTADRRIVRARLWSPRGALRFALRIPERCELQAIGHHDLRLEQRAWPGGVARFTGIGPDGVELEFAVRGGEPVDVDLIDASAELPPSGARLVNARSPACVPRGEGDVSVIVERVRL